MTTNSSVIISLCSQLCLIDGIKPYETREWSDLADKLMNIGIQPYELAGFNSSDFEAILGMNDIETDRIQKLLGRTGSIAFEISEYEKIGIKIVTRADPGYSKKLKKKLGRQCPPLFYYSGDLSLLEKKATGYVGSRTVGIDDTRFTVDTVKKSLNNEYVIVSGGAKGIDSISFDAALSNNGCTIEFLADSMLNKLKQPEVYDGIQNGRVLLLSFVKPNAGFNTGNAMARNKFIYAQSEGTVAVKADLNKGGTWSGATEDLKKEWCPLLCWNNLAYAGNQALIKKGAIPIDESWDGLIPEKIEFDTKTKEQDIVTGTQISLFE